MQTRGERNQMHARERSDMQNVERGSEQCQAPWKAVYGFHKCYTYKYSEEVVEYIDANQFCQQPGVVGSRLFTPGSLDEMKQVDKAMIPDSVTGDPRNYFTGYVEFGWQSDNPDNLVYAANAYPFELMPKELWSSNNEPNDWLPVREPCTWATGQGIGDWDCVSTSGQGSTGQDTWSLLGSWRTQRDLFKTPRMPSSPFEPVSSPRSSSSLSP